MLFVMSDKHGNSLLLQAAQPRDINEKEFALANLQHRIAAGTLVIDKVPSETPAPVYAGKATIPRLSNPAFFIEVTQGWSQRMLLAVLDTNLASLLRVVRVQVTQPEAAMPSAIIAHNQRRMAEDILQLILNNRLAIGKSSSFNQLLEKYRYAQQLPSATQDISQMLNPDLALFNDDDITAVTEMTDTYQSMLDACTQFCEQYLHSIETNDVPIGAQTLALYAEHIERGLCVWQRGSSTSLDLQLVAMLSEHDKQGNIIHLLQHENGTFSLLVDTSTLAACSTQLEKDQPFELALQLNRNHFLEVNKYGENILLRAVRSVVADELIDYILNDLHYAQKINTTDKLGKTPMHRALRYYADYGDFLMKQFQGDIVKYQALIIKVLTALLQIPALDLTLKELSAPYHTALERAAFYKLQYKLPFDFDLQAWILQTRQQFAPVPPTRDAAPSIPSITVTPPPVSAVPAKAKRGRGRSTPEEQASPIATPPLLSPVAAKAKRGRPLSTPVEPAQKRPRASEHVVATPPVSGVPSTLFAQSPVRTIVPGYQRITTVSNGDCGYDALGMKRFEAYLALSEALDAEPRDEVIRALLRPAMRELFLDNSFLNYLKNQRLIPATMDKKAAEEQIETLAVREDLLRAYLDHMVKGDGRQREWAHMAVLRALAHTENATLRIWRFDPQDRQSGAIVAAYQEMAVYIPENSVRRIDILFVNDNHFERLKFIGYGKQDLPTEIAYPYQLGMIGAPSSLLRPESL